MFEPITTGLAVFSFFNSTMELGKFLLAKKSHATTHAALNGINADLDLVRRNIDAMSSNTNVNFADLGVRTGILLDAT
ncbi:MAG: hypothetical protein IJE97_15540, partial [Thermoguttaceae bacterium]|nr:hypothetical protein [Thermoguttaceae bacterium]